MRTQPHDPNRLSDDEINTARNAAKSISGVAPTEFDEAATIAQRKGQFEADLHQGLRDCDANFDKAIAELSALKVNASAFRDKFSEMKKFICSAEVEEELQLYLSTSVDLVNSMMIKDTDLRKTLRCDQFIETLNSSIDKIYAVKLQQLVQLQSSLTQEDFEQTKQQLGIELNSFIQNMAAEVAKKQKPETQANYQALKMQLDLILQELRDMLRAMLGAKNETELISAKAALDKKIHDFNEVAEMSLNPAVNQQLTNLRHVLSMSAAITSCTIPTLDDRSRAAYFDLAKLMGSALLSLPLTPVALAQARGMQIATIAEENAAKAYTYSTNVISPAMTAGEKIATDTHVRASAPQPPAKTGFFNTLRKIGSYIVNQAIAIKNFVRDNPLKTLLACALAAAAFTPAILFLGPLMGISLVVGTGLLLSTAYNVYARGQVEFDLTRRTHERMDQFKQLVFETDEAGMRKQKELSVTFQPAFTASPTQILGRLSSESGAAPAVQPTPLPAEPAPTEVKSPAPAAPFEAVDQAPAADQDRPTFKP